MAYFEQTLMSATADETSPDNTHIEMVNGAIADSYINKAVTYDGQPSDLANPKVKLAGDDDIVIGSIVGVSYGKLQIAVDGWDVKFLVATNADIAPGTRIIGAEMSATQKGYVKAVSASPGATWNQAASDALSEIGKGRGSVLNGNVDAAGDVVRVTMKFGG